MTDISNNESQTYDAQALSEEISTGEQKAPKVNVEADYAASKEYSQSEIDKTGQGAEKAAAATASKFDVPEPEEPKHDVQVTGNPDDYREMAKEVNPQIQ